MIRIEFNDAEVQEGLGALSALLADMTPVMDEIGEALVASTEARFAAGKAPDGTPWAPKSETTLARYHQGHDKVDTRPLHGPSLQLSRTIHHQATAHQVEVGSSRIYAAVMQFGAAQGEFGARMGRTRPTDKRPKSQDYFFHIPWGDIPARPFLGVSEDDRSAIMEIIGEWFERAAGNDPD